MTGISYDTDICISAIFLQHKTIGQILEITKQVTQAINTIEKMTVRIEDGKFFIDIKFKKKKIQEWADYNTLMSEALNIGVAFTNYSNNQNSYR